MISRLRKNDAHSQLEVDAWRTLGRWSGTHARNGQRCRAVGYGGAPVKLHWKEPTVTNINEK